MPETAEGTPHNSENAPQFGLLEPIRFGNNEILRFKPNNEDIRIDPHTGEKVKPLFYVQGINGDGKLPWTLEAFAREQQREVIAIRYAGKFEGSASKRKLITLAEDSSLSAGKKLQMLASGDQDTSEEKLPASVVTEMDDVQAAEIIAAINALGINQVDAVAESRGAIRLIDAMQKSPDHFGHVFLAHPAGLVGRGFFKSHLDAIRGGFYHAARKAMGRVEKHTSDRGAITNERRWFRDPRGWRKAQKSVAHADIRAALAAYANNYPDKQIRIAGDQHDKSFLATRLAKNANEKNVQFVETNWGGHGIGINLQAVRDISASLSNAEIL